MSPALAKKAPSAPMDHPSYKDMIATAIFALKERTGSSRQAIKKYVESNYKINKKTFESQFRSAVARGIASGDLLAPKGKTGSLKLAKKTGPAKKPSSVKKPMNRQPAGTTKKPMANPKTAQTKAKSSLPARPKPKTSAVKTKGAKVTKKTPVKKTSSTKAAVSKASKPRKTTSKGSIKK